jgi:S1-C subfamily serine protease
LIDVDRRLVITNSHVVIITDNFGQVHKDPVTVFFPAVQDGKVVAERDYYYVPRTQAYTGTVKYNDDVRDLAIVQLDALPGGVSALKLAKESSGPAETVHSIGNPGVSGALWVYTFGKVRSVYQHSWNSGPAGSANLKNLRAKVVETNLAINPGDSGGPVVNDYGELVGVTQGYSANANQVSFAIDITEVHRVLAEAKATMQK